MTPRRYGPLEYVPITRRTKLTWPGGARVALWVNPNIEFFGLDDVMPGNLNERVPREHARSAVCAVVRARRRGWSPDIGHGDNPACLADDRDTLRRRRRDHIPCP